MARSEIAIFDQVSTPAVVLPMCKLSDVVGEVTGGIAADRVLIEP